MNTNRTLYRAAVALWVGTGLFLVWSALAMGVNGREGDPFERIYLGVLAVGVLSAFAARFQPRGMSAALFATAGAQAAVVVIALLLGKQNEGATSVLEILAVNGFFILMFATSGWLFQRSVRPPAPEAEGPTRPAGKPSGLQT